MSRTKKYICDYPEMKFILKEKDKKGNVVTHTDAKGNNKLPNIKEYKFKSCPVRDPKTGKIKPDDGYCFFLAVEKDLKGEYDRIVEHLDKLMENPKNQLYLPKDHLKKRNPEAAAHLEEKTKIVLEKDKVIADKDKYIKDLEKKLGFKN